MAKNPETRKKKMHTARSSDRRLASGPRADSYLLSSHKNVPLRKTEPANPKHFRLFVGNLGPDASDGVLAAAFAAYVSVSTVHVPVDPKTGQNRGYGFVAFARPDDYLRAFKEMNGQYVGLRPVQLKRAAGKPR